MKITKEHLCEKPIEVSCIKCFQKQCEKERNIGRASAESEQVKWMEKEWKREYKKGFLLSDEFFKRIKTLQKGANNDNN